MINRVDRIGVEIEGGWKSRPARFHSDCSVHGSRVDWYGEVVSTPLQTPTEVKRFIKRHYPITTNKSCGFHIHISFKKDSDYKKLMTKHFYKIFIENAREWGKENKINEGTQFWNRLEGKNNWCKSLIGAKKGQFKISIVKQQRTARGKTGPRYYHLNFCKNAHNTVECRLFPAFKKYELAQKAVDFFYNLCNNYVQKTTIIEVKKKKKKKKTTKTEIKIYSDSGELKGKIFLKKTTSTERFREIKLGLIRNGELTDGLGWIHESICSCEFDNSKPISVCEPCYFHGVRVTDSIWIALNRNQLARTTPTPTEQRTKRKRRS